MSIEAIFRVRIDYEADDWGIVEDAFFTAMENKQGVANVEAFGGCPACGPYLTVECRDEATALRAERAIKNAIIKGKGKVMEPSFSSLPRPRATQRSSSVSR